MASIVRLDKVRACYIGHIASVIHSAQMENGNVVTLGTLNDRDLFNVVVPTAGAGGLYVINAPEIMYKDWLHTDRALANFVIPANTEARAYRLEADDIISISIDGLTALASDVVVGNFVVAQAGLKLKEIASTTTELFVGKIIATETIGTNTFVGGNGQIGRLTEMVVIRVIKN